MEVIITTQLPLKMNRKFLIEKHLLLLEKLGSTPINSMTRHEETEQPSATKENKNLSIFLAGTM